MEERIPTHMVTFHQGLRISGILYSVLRYCPSPSIPDLTGFATYMIGVRKPFYREVVQLCQCFYLGLSKCLVHLPEADEILHDGSV